MFRTGENYRKLGNTRSQTDTRLIRTTSMFFFTLSIEKNVILFVNKFEIYGMKYVFVSVYSITLILKLEKLSFNYITIY